MFRFSAAHAFHRVKQLSDYPIKFYARDSSVVKFKLAAGSVVSFKNSVIQHVWPYSKVSTIG